MKKLLIPLLLVACPVLANPITDAVKEQAWPVYTCTMDVNGKDVITVTDDSQYSKYSMQPGIEMFTYSINEKSDLTLVIDKTVYSVNQNNSFGAVAYLYKDTKIVSQYNGICIKN